jgi:hypothetical protein
MDKFTQSLNSISQMADQVGGMGGILGGAQGNLGLAMAIARQMGLIITSTTGGRHAPGSYHYAGRAVDVSNGVNTREQMAFAQRMASQFGTSIKELFYDPLGWSVKNGSRAPYTIGGHSDHVHVAFGMGAASTGGGGPVAFDSLSDARSWEGRMAPRDARIASVTSNSSEFGGGTTTINAPITINALPGQDASDIADVILLELDRRISRTRSSSLFFS